jgi:cellulose synthase/poly-beta-1,6-N-acetylglucosamine synthase-like glycosyltransferase
MLALQILRWLLMAAEVLIALPVLYLCILSLSTILTTRKNKTEGTAYVSSESSLADFAILIPAHNEERILQNLLNSLTELAYPKDRLTVYVVADNCTDRTAELARATGSVRVFERFDETRRGKGYALSWLLQQLEENQLNHDAYVILDADSVVESTFLRAMNRGLAAGARALQANNTVLNISDSPSTALRLIAMTLMNHVRPLGRNGLGGSSTLTGNGMCLSRALLMQYPWQAFVIAEDYQYYLTLVQHGERVQYMPEAIVRSHMPLTFSSMRTQDVRWEASELSQPTLRIAIELFKAGLQLRNFVCFEAIAELLTPPLSFLVGSCLITLIVSLLVWSLPGLLLSLLLMCGLMCYISTAFYLLRPPHEIYVAFLHAPGFMIWKLWIYFVVRRNKKHSREWIRTSRTSL